MSTKQNTRCLKYRNHNTDSQKKEISKAAQAVEQ